MSSSGVRVFDVKGWAKRFGMSLKSQGNKHTFWRDIPGFVGARKVGEMKVCVRSVAPKYE